MSEKVVRYSMTAWPDGSLDASPTDMGAWVRYSDYAALAVELEKADAAGHRTVGAMTDEPKERCGYCGLFQCRCDASELRAERDALAERVEDEKNVSDQYKAQADAEYKGYLVLTERVAVLEPILRRRLEHMQQQGAEIARLKAALEEYGHHKPHCDADPCTCGILAALEVK